MINKILIKYFDTPQNYEDFDILLNRSHFDILCDNSLGHLLFLEYNDVYTVGRFTKNKNYKNLPFVRSSRGGDITFHGHGQQVFYPVLNIKRLGISLHDFIDLMHNFLIKFRTSLFLLKSKKVMLSRASSDFKLRASLIACSE